MSGNFIGAVIEVGTNSIKLLIGKLEKKNKLKTLTYTRDITRLGEGLKQSGILKVDAIKRSVETIEKYHKQAESAGAKKIEIVGTHVLRRAENPLNFIWKVKEATGLEVEILSEQQESFAARDGVMLDYEKQEGKEIVILDIGGGSTEIIKEIWTKSIPVGAVSITESMFNEDPPKDNQLVRAATRIRDIFMEEITFMIAGERIQAVGVGGTLTAAAALAMGLDEFEPDKIHHFQLEESAVNQLIDKLKSVSLEKRKQMMSFDPQRADIIIGGMIILKVFFKFFDVEKFTVSVNNVIHGIFYQKFARYFWSEV